MMIRFRVWLFLGAVQFLVSSGSWACSVCIAHALGAGQAGLGSQILHKGRAVAGVSFLALSKSSAGEEEGMLETEHQQETSFDVFYGIGARGMVRASLPFVHKTIEMGGEGEESANGFGDVTIGYIYQLKPRMGDRVVTAISFDVKLPTGENDARDGEGELREQHLQLGTGSTDYAAGLLWTWEAAQPDALWFCGLKYRRNGDNDRNFHYGNVLFYHLGYSHPLPKHTALVFELNGRFARKDKTEDGSTDENSGGQLTYFSLSYRRPMSGSVGLVAGVQIPVLRNLYGTQTEKSLFSLSLAQSW